MRLVLRYLKQRLKLYLAGLLFFVIFLVSFVLYHLPIEAVIYPFFLCAALTLVFSVIDFLRLKKRHEILSRIKSITDVIECTFPEVEGIADADYMEIIRLISEEHSRYSSFTNREYADMIDYYTVWAHRIKTPIASMRLNLQAEDAPLSRRLYSDLHRIEQYVEMVLTFIRLNSDSTDYVIREYDLDKIVKQAVKKFSHEFIGRKLSLCYQSLNATVITDEKWLSFVIEQILSNALKYTRTGSITISLSDDKRLSVTDTGIGIAADDLPRIFENGYTGFNGRTDKAASGIGLYLCKRICGNLGHGISVQSEIDRGTTITINLAQQKIEVE